MTKLSERDRNLQQPCASGASHRIRRARTDRTRCPCCSPSLLPQAKRSARASRRYWVRRRRAAVSAKAVMPDASGLTPQENMSRSRGISCGWQNYSAARPEARGHDAHRARRYARTPPKGPKRCELLRKRRDNQSATPAIIMKINVEPDLCVKTSRLLAAR